MVNCESFGLRKYMMSPLSSIFSLHSKQCMCVGVLLTEARLPCFGAPSSATSQVFKLFKASHTHLMVAVKPLPPKLSSAVGLAQPEASSRPGRNVYADLPKEVTGAA